MSYLKSILYLTLFLILAACSTSRQITELSELPLNEKIEIFKMNFNNGNIETSTKLPFIITSIEIDNKRKKFNFSFKKNILIFPIREENINSLKKTIAKNLELDINHIHLYSDGIPLYEFIPNFYRTKTEIDKLRLPLPKHTKNRQVVKNISLPYVIANGLQNKNIALWHSHGWYYNNEEKRWKWQRPRLFQSVEDLLPMQFTIPYLIPMLENAGANVYVPRERDIQTNEVIVDNDSSEETSFKKGKGWKRVQKGFTNVNTPYQLNYNPFEHGSSNYTLSQKINTSQIKWIPKIPETGFYSVYITYNASNNGVEDANYIVNHLGGETEFSINQTIGGSSWYYLGTFKFNKGICEKRGSVILNNKSIEPNKIISADAVRFGGGMGIVEREGSTSNRPKFTEGAKYYLQFLGMPDTLVYNLNNNQDDYKDDYQSRGKYVNYLNDSLKIPIDLSFAFHTDAGINKEGSTIGTLSIYSLKNLADEKEFKNGISRFANRDLSDLIQTQIVDDIHKLYNKNWKRRKLYDAKYSEATIPEIPSSLLELLSHQNLTDIKYALNPKFRFHISRAIYKAMLKFISFEYHYKPIIQPLPVTHFRCEFIGHTKIKLSWKPTEDLLERTASPTGFIVYTKIDSSDFDNGIYVADTSKILSIKEDKIYSFKITALNKGGESFPSETLSLCRLKKEKGTILIVNCFDRVEGPYFFENEKSSGFNSFIDNGVPDNYDIGFTGFQYDFINSSQYISDDSPGHGSSFADYETKIIAGNTHNFPFIHGSSIAQAGYSFISTSDEAVYDKNIFLTNYKIVDLILGEEKLSHSLKNFGVIKFEDEFEIFPKIFRTEISKFLSTKGKLFISGAYIVTDLFGKGNEKIDFAKNVLKMDYGSTNASLTGKTFGCKNSFLCDMKISFNNKLNKKIYCVEAPESIIPINGSKTILRYEDNSFSAGISYKGNYSLVTIGFPFETILSKTNRDIAMKKILKFLDE